MLQACGKVVSGPGQILHNGSVTALAETNELVVLTENLAGTFGEVEGEGSLVCAEIVDIEDKFFG